MMSRFDGAAWLKSSYSNGDGGNCVEVAHVGDRVGVRDSKDPGGGVLDVSRRAWQAFLRDVRSGAL